MSFLKDCDGRRSPFNSKSCYPTFFFDTAGAKKKVHKKETPRMVSSPAGDDQGYAPWMGASFLKKLDKNLQSALRASAPFPPFFTNSTG